MYALCIVRFTIPQCHDFFSLTGILIGSDLHAESRRAKRLFLKFARVLGGILYETILNGRRHVYLVHGNLLVS